MKGTCLFTGSNTWTAHKHCPLPSISYATFWRTLDSTTSSHKRTVDWPLFAQGIWRTVTNAYDSCANTFHAKNSICPMATDVNSQTPAMIHTPVSIPCRGAGPSNWLSNSTYCQRLCITKPARSDYPLSNHHDSQGQVCCSRSLPYLKRAQRATGFDLPDFFGPFQSWKMASVLRLAQRLDMKKNS